MGVGAEGAIVARRADVLEAAKAEIEELSGGSSSLEDGKECG